MLPHVSVSFIHLDAQGENRTALLLSTTDHMAGVQPLAVGKEIMNLNMR